jgi:hypothetical protein
VQRVALKRTRGDAPAAHAEPSAGGAHLRRARPAEQPLPATFKWLARVPAEVRPVELLKRYPRVANALASSWPDPVAFRAMLYDLLVDKRGGRKGFGHGVEAELLRLRTWYEEMDAIRTLRLTRKR